MHKQNIKTFGFESVSYRFTLQIIGIESFCNANYQQYENYGTKYLCLVFSNFKYSCSIDKCVQSLCSCQGVSLSIYAVI